MGNNGKRMPGIFPQELVVRCISGICAGRLLPGGKLLDGKLQIVELRLSDVVVGYAPHLHIHTLSAPPIQKLCKWYDYDTVEI